MTKTVFISRDLDEYSAFTALLHAAGWQVRGLSLVTLTALPFDEIPEVDWIFFASKNAVRFFFGGGVSPGSNVPKKKPYRIFTRKKNPVRLRYFIKWQRRQRHE